MTMSNQANILQACLQFEITQLKATMVNKTLQFVLLL
jgi:hypothetical protein